MFIVLTYFWLSWVRLHIWLTFTIHNFIFHFKCYNILHFAECQLLCWTFLLFLFFRGGGLRGVIIVETGFFSDVGSGQLHSDMALVRSKVIPLKAYIGSQTIINSNSLKSILDWWRKRVSDRKQFEMQCHSARGVRVRGNACVRACVPESESGSLFATQRVF